MHSYIMSQESGGWIPGTRSLEYDDVRESTHQYTVQVLYGMYTLITSTAIHIFYV